MLGAMMFGFGLTPYVIAILVGASPSVQGSVALRGMILGELLFFAIRGWPGLGG